MKCAANRYYEGQPKWECAQRGHRMQPRNGQKNGAARRKWKGMGEAEEKSVGEGERSGSSEPPAPEGVGSDATAALELVTQKHSDPFSRSARFVNACARCARDPLPAPPPPPLLDRRRWFAESFYDR